MPESADESAEYVFPVTPAQSRLLVLDGLAPGSAQYSMYMGYEVEGPFDTAAFAAAVGEVVNRHEALRTVFRVQGDTFMQVVREEVPSVCLVLRDVPVEGIAQTVAEHAALPFDLENGPLFRAVVYEVDDGIRRVLLVAHHAVADGWSLGIIVRELAACYRLLRGGAAPDLPEPGLQYGDFAVWYAERLAAGDFDPQVDYWSARLADAPPVLPLPSELPRPRLRTPLGGHVMTELSESTSAALAQLGRDLGTTPTAVLLAAFGVFLGRLSGRSDVVVGVPVAGRDRPDLHELVGMLVNTVGLRIEIDSRLTFRQLVQQIGRSLAAARANQDAPFDAVVARVAPARALDHDPVYQAVFALDDFDALDLDLDGARVRRMGLFLDVAKFDFMAQVERSGGRLSIRLVYRPELFPASTIERWAGLFETLLAELAADGGERPVRAADWLTGGDRGTLLELAVGPRAEVPEVSVAELIARQVRERPDARALVTAESVLSYAELDALAARIAAGLRAHGVGPGRIVGLCIPRGQDLPLAVLGVLKAGAAYLPLEPEYPAERLALLIADAGASHVIADPGTCASVRAGGAPVLLLSEVIDAADEPPAVEACASPDDLAYVIHTSGSTGTPKAVGISQRSLVDYAVTRAEVFGLDHRDRVLNAGSFSFDISVATLFTAWAVGAELHLSAADERIGAPLLARLRDSEITMTLLLPSVVAALPCSPDDLPALRTLVLGAEPLPAALVRDWARGRRLFNAYGPTEATVCATVAELAPEDAVDIGRPLPNTRVYVLDDVLRPVPIGVVGEIYLAGPGLARGYVGRSALTAERFVADPHADVPGSRMYRTGDLGRYVRSGRLEILGRSDDQVKVRGYRIEPGEIEAVLAEYPGVARAAVVARAEAGDEPRLVGYAEPREQASVTEYELRDWLARRLPAHLVPAVIVLLDRLPTSVSDKVDRAALPAPAQQRPEQARPYAAPRTDVERRIAAVWQEVLRIDRAGIHDGFFELGGDSVRLLRVHTRLTRPVDDGRPLDVELVDLFAHPTIGALAAHLDGAAAEPRARAGDPGARGATRRARLDAPTARSRHRPASGT